MGDGHLVGHFTRYLYSARNIYIDGGGIDAVCLAVTTIRGVTANLS